MLNQSLRAKISTNPSVLLRDAPARDYPLPWCGGRHLSGYIMNRFVARVLLAGFSVSTLSPASAVAAPAKPAAAPAPAAAEPPPVPRARATPEEKAKTLF